MGSENNMVASIKAELERQMDEDMADHEHLPSSVARDRGLTWLEGWFDLSRLTQPDAQQGEDLTGPGDGEDIVKRAVDRIMTGFSWETLDGPENLRARLSMCARDALGQERRMKRDARQGASSPASGEGGAEWQPYATAPRDGTWVLLAAAGPEAGQVVAHWDSDWNGGWWLCDDGKCAIELPLRGAEPTYWMPLAATPLAAATQPAGAGEGEGRYSDAQLREAIRKAKNAAASVYGISWTHLEEISQVELILAALTGAGENGEQGA